MRPVLPGLLFLGLVTGGCAASERTTPPPPSSTGGTPATPATGGTGGTPSEGTGGIIASAPDAALSSSPDAAETTDGATAADGASAPATDGGTPMGYDGGPLPSYEGEIPVYYGPDVGPAITMECPGDPTMGFTEYQDSFHVERPYKVPLNTRFSIEGGIYNFWVFPNDSPHSPIANGKNPRTEAAYGATYDMANVTGKGNAEGIGWFGTGKRIYTADMMVENSAKNSIVLQLHTTATGIGPVYLSGGGIPGGKLGQWFNIKMVFDASTLKTQVFINNCMKGTVSGPKGDGHFYWKNGVYHCDSADGCRTHYKNVHLYIQK